MSIVVVEGVTMVDDVVADIGMTVVVLILHSSIKLARVPGTLQLNLAVSV